MNKQILKIWVENKVSNLEFKKTLYHLNPDMSRNPSIAEIDSQIELLKEFWEDFNLQDVEYEFQKGLY